MGKTKTSKVPESVGRLHEYNLPFDVKIFMTPDKTRQYVEYKGYSPHVLKILKSLHLIQCKEEKCSKFIHKKSIYQEGQRYCEIPPGYCRQQTSRKKRSQSSVSSSIDPSSASNHTIPSPISMSANKYDCYSPLFSVLNSNVITQSSEILSSPDYTFGISHESDIDQCSGLDCVTAYNNPLALLADSSIKLESILPSSQVTFNELYLNEPLNILDSEILPK